jgi:hypothetical protein
VSGAGGDTGLYRLLNDPVIRDGVVAGAAARYGYRPDQVELRLYVGKFAGRSGGDEAAVREWCAAQTVASGPITVVALNDVIEKVRSVALQRTYLNNPIVVSMKVLAAARLLDLTAPLVQPEPDALDEAGIEGEVEDS